MLNKMDYRGGGTIRTDKVNRSYELTWSYDPINKLSEYRLRTISPLGTIVRTILFVRIDRRGGRFL